MNFSAQNADALTYGGQPKTLLGPHRRGVEPDPVVFDRHHELRIFQAGKSNDDVFGFRVPKRVGKRAL